ncbi:MAG: hypothetical protein H7336_14105 [Bacteriovorax sp.]|nr:hypothetical protein [Bacteriovorax sp.]
MLNTTKYSMAQILFLRASGTMQFSAKELEENRKINSDPVKTFSIRATS